jgi:hypothetical protein
MSPTVISTADHSGRIPDSDWVATLDRYHHMAADVLHEHCRSGLRCGACAQPWPCTAACAAAFALEL